MALMLEIAGAAFVVVAMAAVYVLILRGVKDDKSWSRGMLKKLQGDRRGPEFVNGLLAVLSLAALTAATGTDFATAVAGAGIAILAFVCRLMPDLVKLPIHAMYSVLGILGALAAARDYLFPADSISGGGLLLRWVVLALVWSFATFGTLASFAAGKADWNVGLLLFAWIELVIYVTVPLEMSQLDNLWAILGVLAAALFFGFFGTWFRDVVEIAAAAAMTLGSFALTAGEAGISGSAGYLKLTSSTFSMILTFAIVYVLLRAVSNRWTKAPLVGRKS